MEAVDTIRNERQVATLTEPEVAMLDRCVYDQIDINEVNDT